MNLLKTIAFVSLLSVSHASQAHGEEPHVHLTEAQQELLKNPRFLLDSASQLLTSKKIQDTAKILVFGINNLPSYNQAYIDEACHMLFSIMYMHDKHAKAQPLFNRCSEEQKTNWYGLTEREHAETIIRYEPLYPQSLVGSKVEGQVELIFDVDPRGYAQNVKVLSSSNPAFDKESIASVQTWRYLPKMKNGMAVVDSGVKVTLTFKVQP